MSTDDLFAAEEQVVAAAQALIDGGRFAGPADAKHYVKDGRYYAKKGKHNYRYYPSARWFWVGSGLGYGAAAVTGNCRYYHRQWVISGKDHWRRKYNYCVD